MKIPLAESFHSIQGEGYHAGTPMYFIRLAGCSVGRRVVQLGREDSQDHNSPSYATDLAPTLPSGQPAFQCTRFDGVPFWCDTDYNVKARVELEDLMHDTWEHHICLTGGEPLNHPEIAARLHELCADLGKTLHIETSGTVEWHSPYYSISHRLWMTVAPKLGCLDSMIAKADEIKLLINPVHFAIPESINRHKRVYLSPINDVDHLPNSLNLELCIETLRHHPDWKLSVQLHKYLGVR